MKDAMDANSHMNAPSHFAPKTNVRHAVIGAIDAIEKESPKGGAR